MIIEGSEKRKFRKRSSHIIGTTTTFKLTYNEKISNYLLSSHIYILAIYIEVQFIPFIK